MADALPKYHRKVIFSCISSELARRCALAGEHNIQSLRLGVLKGIASGQAWRRGWQGRRVLITGGASFFGAHLAHALLALGARVRVIDDLSRGPASRLITRLLSGVELHVSDVRSRCASPLFKGAHHVFHFAARHGGRGYIEQHQDLIADNFEIDDAVMEAAARHEVGHVLLASSACVYPVKLQSRDHSVFLCESLPLSLEGADHTYGAAKLAAELSLRAQIGRGRLRGSVCRYFTIYGPGSPLDHSVTALIAKSLAGHDRLPVWGSGDQSRTWVYISDAVRATLSAAVAVQDGTPINVGTLEELSAAKAAAFISRVCGGSGEVTADPSMPEGPFRRVPRTDRAATLLGWRPRVNFAEGVRRTVRWYREHSHLDPSRYDRVLVGPEAQCGARA